MFLKVAGKDLDLRPFKMSSSLSVWNFHQSHIKFWTRTLTGLTELERINQPLKQAFFDLTFILPDISEEKAVEWSTTCESLDKILPHLAPMIELRFSGWDGMDDPQENEIDLGGLFSDYKEGGKNILLWLRAWFRNVKSNTSDHMG